MKMRRSREQQPERRMDGRVQGKARDLVEERRVRWSFRGVRERCGGLLRSTDGESGVFPKLVVRFSERWFVDPREERRGCSSEYGRKNTKRRCPAAPNIAADNFPK